MLSKFFKKVFGKNEESSAEDSKKEQLNTMWETVRLKSFLYYESVFNHQRMSLRRSTGSNRLKLGEILEIFNVKKDDVNSMAVTFRSSWFDNSEEEAVIDNKNDVWDYDILSQIIDLDASTLRGAMISDIGAEKNVIVETKDRNFIITFMFLGGCEDYKYVRATILSPDNSPVDDFGCLNSENLPIAVSTVLSHCEEENDDLLIKYLEVEKSALKKLKKGRNYDKYETEYIYGIGEFRLWDYINEGKYLYEQGRIHDAYVILLRAFNLMIIDINNVNNRVHLKEKMDDLFYVCNTIGRCLMLLGRADEADYYFELGSKGLPPMSPSEQALSHAVLGDCDAIGYMEQWVDKIKKITDDNTDDNMSELIESFTKDVPDLLRLSKKKFEENLKKHPCYDPTISIGSVLNPLYGIKEKNLFPIMLIYDLRKHAFLTKIEDRDEIYNYALNAEEAKDKIFILSCTFRESDDDNDSENPKKKDRSNLSWNAPLIIATHAVKGNNSSALMRVDISRSNFPGNDENMEPCECNIPAHFSFVMGCQKGSSFNYDKEGLIAGINQVFEYADEKRHFEIYKLAKWIFECSRNHLKDSEGLYYVNQDEYLYFLMTESAFHTGFSLMEFGFLKAAFYYLMNAKLNETFRNLDEFINFLEHAQDPFTLQYIIRILERYSQYTPSDEKDADEWDRFMDGLQMHMISILNRQNDFEAARGCLRQMLEKPSLKEFAQTHLDHIEKLEQG